MVVCLSYNLAWNCMISILLYGSTRVCIGLLENNKVKELMKRQKITLEIRRNLLVKQKEVPSYTRNTAGTFFG